MRIPLCRLRVVSAALTPALRRVVLPDPCGPPGGAEVGAPRLPSLRDPPGGRGLTGGSARAKGGGGHRETGRVPALSALR